MKVLYTAVATASGDGRNGRTASDDGLLDVAVQLPPDLGGKGGATNPEQLFAAGYAACFHSAVKHIAGPDGLDVSDTEVTMRVALGTSPEGDFDLAVEIDFLAPHLDSEAARALLERAHVTCPYSRAVRGNVEVTLHLIENT